MLNMKQKSGETITEFCNRIQEAGSLAYTESEQADEACLLTLLRGLTNKNIRQKLNEATVATFSEAKRMAKRIESVAKMFEQEPTSILKTSSEAEDRSRSRAPFESNERSTSRGRSPTPHWRTQNSRESYRSNSRGKYRSNSRSRDRSYNRNSRSGSRNGNYSYNNRSDSRNRYQNSRNKGRSSSRNRGNDWKQNIRCWHCDKIGHFKSECRDLN